MIHYFEDGWGCIRSGHTLGDCRMFNELSNSLKEEKQREAKRTRRAEQSPTPSPERRYNSPQGQVCMIQEGRPSKAQQDAYTLQSRAAENLHTIEVYQLHGAETSITFS